MSDQTLAIETALLTALATLPAYLMRAPSGTPLTAGYVVVSPAPGSAGGRYATHATRSRTRRYLVKAIATTRSQALTLFAQADGIIAGLALDAWSVRLISTHDYQEPLGGGQVAQHAGGIYELHSDE